MRGIARVVLVATVATLTGAVTSHATSHQVPRGSVVQLHNGPNVVDLLGDGHQAQVFVARRENYNAHGFSVVAFYVRDSSWQLVPFFGGPHDPASGRETYLTTEGADCTLGDLRVVRQPRGSVQVVLASRALGKSFADPAAVQFQYYELRRNADGLAGWPTYYFQQTRTVPARHPYCDVNEAFARDLALGPDGIGHGEGGR